MYCGLYLLEFFFEGLLLVVMLSLLVKVQFVLYIKLLLGGLMVGLYLITLNS
jgi:hypothetical protein